MTMSTEGRAVNDFRNRMSPERAAGFFSPASEKEYDDSVDRKGAGTQRSWVH